MSDINRVVHTVSVLALGSIVVGNGILFTLSFPGSPWNTRTALPVTFAARLPLQPDAYIVSTPPPFLAEITATDISLSSMSPSPRVLLRRRADRMQPLASLTKLMTAYVVLQHAPAWEKEVTFIKEDQRGGVITPLTPGAIISVDDLWKLSLVASDNDATMALARSTGLSESDFARAMNEVAKKYSFDEMHFVEPTGLSPQNIASARDFAAFARKAFTEPRIRDTVSLSQTHVTVSSIAVRVLSSDQLLKFHKAGDKGWSFMAAKTGFVDEAGYNVAMLAQTNTGADLLLILLGSTSVESRANESARLIAWAAQNLSVEK